MFCTLTRKFDVETLMMTIMQMQKVKLTRTKIRMVDCNVFPDFCQMKGFYHIYTGRRRAEKFFVAKTRANQLLLLTQHVNCGGKFLFMSLHNSMENLFSDLVDFICGPFYSRKSIDHTFDFIGPIDFSGYEQEFVKSELWQIEAVIEKIIHNHSTN